ncbi:unknown protein [Microcystis aeruginosa NIES-843]|uniref:Uncharacterized protein n=1 Tax=Microcystis aeruginosa (strain NIES-843 / IAM M-2473) TaxID=449447 RepID=B0JTA5_MICAN|nr:unknown protein [Microcystis aeruginosa NIES-843]
MSGENPVQARPRQKISLFSLFGCCFLALTSAGYLSCFAPAVFGLSQSLIITLLRDLCQALGRNEQGDRI